MTTRAVCLLAPRGGGHEYLPAPAGRRLRGVQLLVLRCRYCKTPVSR